MSLTDVDPDQQIGKTHIYAMLPHGKKYVRACILKGSQILPEFACGFVKSSYYC